LNAPQDNDKFQYNSGSPDSIRFDWSIYTSDVVPFNYTWQFKNKSDPQAEYQDVQSFQLDTSKTDQRISNEQITTLPNIGLPEFGEFSWRLETVDREKNDSVVSSVPRSFRAVPETGEPLLVFSNPDQNDVEYTDNEQLDYADVGFKFSVKDSPEDGTLSLSVDGDKIYSEDVGSGSTQRVEAKQIPIGDHQATVRFKSDSFDKNISHSFRVERFTESEPNQTTVRLRSPEGANGNDPVLYQGVADIFSWVVYADNPYETELTIEDDQGSVVDTYYRDSDRTGEISVFRELNLVNLSQGDYSFSAYVNTTQGEYDETDVRNFTVVDFDTPDSSLQSPQNGSTFTTDEKVNFSWETETFDESFRTQLLVREADSVNPRTLYNKSQSPFLVESHLVSEDFPAGEYRWKVRNKRNPESESEEFYFTVEDTDTNPPDIHTVSPSQNYTYTVDDFETTTDVYFNYSVEVFTEGDSDVDLLLSREDNGLSNFTVQASDTQDTNDGKVDYSKLGNLEEDGYFWKVRVTHPDGDQFTTDETGFSVGNATAPRPDDGTDEEKKGGAIGTGLRTIIGVIAVFGSVIGGVGRLLVASIITILVGGLTAKISNEVGILAVVLMSFVFVVSGWMYSWVGTILFLIGAGIFIISIRKVTGGD